MCSALDPAHGDPRRARLPLVGRAAEVSRFERLLGDGGRGIVLHGDAGTGKTRLAEELVALAEQSGYVARFVRGRAAIADLPLTAFAPLLPGDVDRYEGVSLIVAARTTIAALGGERPLVLGIDDAHLLDASSATLVHQLVSAGSIIVVATIRDGEWLPEPIAELCRSGLVERWPVGDLGRDETIAMAQALLDDDLGPDTADELVRLTGCNPLFVSTLARTMIETGTTTDLATITSSPKLVDFVAGRLSWLDPAGRDTLAAVALAEPIGLAILEEVTEPRALVELERGGWITVTQDGRRTVVRLAHPLYGEVLRGNLSRLLARTIYRELAAAVQARGARRHDDLMRVAAWSLDGGAPVPPERLVAAAGQALQVGDFVLAEQLAEVAWDAGPRFDAGIILLLIHESRRFQDDRDGFIRTLSTCVSAPVEVAQLATTQAYEAFWRNAELPRALAILDDGIARLDTLVDADPTALAEATDELHGQRAALLVHCGDVDDARAALEPLRHTTSPRVRSTFQYANRLLETAYGDARRIIDGVDAFVITPPSAEDELGLLAQRIRQAGLGKTLVQAAQATRAEATVRAAVDAAAGSHLLASSPENQLAWVLMWRGRSHEGYELAHRAATFQRRHGYRSLERWSRGVMALCAAHAGDHDAAERALAEVEALSPVPAVVWDADLWHARVMMSWLRKDIPHGQQWARRGAAEAAERGLRFDEALGWYLLARFGKPSEAIDHLEPLAAELGGLPELFAMYTRALVAHDAEQVGAAAEAFTSAGIEGTATNAARLAARWYAESGDERAAARWRRRSAELATACDVIGPVIRPSDVEPLSRREREIAELAADGVSSRDIGERLFVSVRTVENHLGRVYDKLGVRGRTELADALSRTFAGD